jgi:hypothetical protein
MYHADSNNFHNVIDSKRVPELSRSFQAGNRSPQNPGSENIAVGGGAGTAAVQEELFPADSAIPGNARGEHFSIDCPSGTIA